MAWPPGRRSSAVGRAASGLARSSPHGLGSCRLDPTRSRPPCVVLGDRLHAALAIALAEDDEDVVEHQPPDLGRISRFTHAVPPWALRSARALVEIEERAAPAGNGRVLVALVSRLDDMSRKLWV